MRLGLLCALAAPGMALNGLVSVGLASLVACSSNDPFLSAGFDAGVEDATVTKDSSVANDGGNRDGGGDATVDGGADAAAETGPLYPPSLCARTTQWGKKAKLRISSAADEHSLAITPDELTLAWIREEGGGPLLLVAERASSADSFAAPVTVAVTVLSAGGATLAGSGLTLTYVSSGDNKLHALTRATRNDAFATQSDSIVNNVNAAVMSPVDPVETSTYLYFTDNSAASASLFLARRIFPTGPWDPPVRLPQTPAELMPQGPKKRRPTGAALDERTLFYWDEVSGTEKAAFTAQGSLVFDTFVDLGDRRYAQPNADCSALYSVSAGDLYVEYRP